MSWGLNSKGSAKTDTMVKLVLIFFISLLSFSVGTFVGKQFSDSQYKMAALEGGDAEYEDSNRDPASVDPTGMDVTPSDALTDEDITSLEEEFTKPKGEAHAEEHEKVVEHKEAAHEEKVVAHHSEPAHKEAHAEKHEAVKHEPVHAAEKAATKVAMGEMPTAPKETHEKRQPSALPLKAVNDASGKYTVQLASYGVEADAVEHTKSLKEKGFSAFYVAADIKGKPWYRVNVGLYTTSKEAEVNKKKLLGQPDIKAAIVTRVTQN
ncbi:MAG: SPOR domain-containing protein [Bdellovibrionales bacterium]